MRNADDNDKKIAEKVSKTLLEIGAITLRPANPFRYVTGILSPVYTDCRILISNPKERNKIINFFLQKIKSLDLKFDLVVGTATAGIPHAAWIADRMNLPMVYVRSQAKDHGKGNQIEGIVKNKQKALIIEDLISTGGSSVETAKAIRNAGGKVSYIFSIITYDMKKSAENFKLNKVKLVPLTTFETLVSVAEKNRLIASRDKEMILDWVNDPPTWGKRKGFE